MKTKQQKNGTNRTALLLAIFGMILVASCGKDFEEISFDPDVKIHFSEGGDTSIVDVGKGVMDYTAEINVQSAGAVIRLFQIYEADPRSGNRGALIEQTVQQFDQPESNFSTTYTLSDLTENKCIKVVVTDTLEQVFEKNLLIRITPSVHFSEASRMETAANYYGPFYATWLSGRVYMRDTEHAGAIDFSLGDVVIPAAGEDPVPALVNPAQRTDYDLLTIPGLQEAKFARTEWTPADYRAVSRVDEALITALADPGLDTVKIEAGNVYLFKTANGKKGLIHVNALTRKTATLENTDGQWEERSFYEVGFTTKTVFPAE
ncbi:hypothetical protein [Parapedobacter sp. 10938]|uniref:hypothetical protein n=1 Tax=Parapedobacter flavus TaxID=3110225 RepID=UPI002DB98A00|nr:hypothetical protein [Parapedobacter sp. 10938]MEC3880124.1 hypothetical protein [Parapedobacter sp. 10938]